MLRLLIPVVLVAACAAPDVHSDADAPALRPGVASADFADAVPLQPFDPDASPALFRSRTDTWLAGQSRLESTQAVDGGWPWPLTGTASAYNTAGPIAMGLTAAGDVTDLGATAALSASGDFLLGKTVFTGLDGVLAATLDDRFGGDAATQFVHDNFYAAIAAGTYVHRDGYQAADTADYVQHIREARSNAGLSNLAAWDLGVHYVGAVSVGAADADVWLDGVKEAVNGLVLDDVTTNGVSHSYFDVLGLSGALWALGTAREDFDPTAGAYASASSTEDLLRELMFLQIEETGGWPWSANLGIPGANHESVQASAYAMLAAFTFRETAAVQGARGWLYLVQSQLPTGGWEDFTGSGENNELTGEALWGAAEHQATARMRVDPPEQSFYVSPDPCGQPAEVDLGVTLYELSSRTRGMAAFRFDLYGPAGADASQYDVDVVDFGAVTADVNDGTPNGGGLDRVYAAQDPALSPRLLDEGRFGDRTLATVTAPLPTTAGQHSFGVGNLRVLVYNRLRNAALPPRAHEAVVHPAADVVVQVTNLKGDINLDGVLTAADRGGFDACLGLDTPNCLALFDADCDADVDADDDAQLAIP